MQVQEKLDPLDNPEYRKLLRELYLWLADGTEIHRLEKLKAEIRPSLRSGSTPGIELRTRMAQSGAGL
jgi:hypothetical protein